MDELRQMVGYSRGHEFALSASHHGNEIIAGELGVLLRYPQTFGENAYWLGRVEGLQEVLAERKAGKR